MESRRLPRLSRGRSQGPAGRAPRKVPLQETIKDSRGWGDSTGKYTAAVGYKAIQAIPHVPPDPSPWKTIWHFPSVPKIDMFSWTLTHKSALTSENLKKKGWEGPSNYPLCKDAEETADHLFIECVYTTEVWTHFLNPLSISFPQSPSELISNWKYLSQFSMKKKNLLENCWMWLPKFLFWKVWLERNNIIFREESRTSSQVAQKIKAMMSESLNSNQTLKNFTPLTPEEDLWLTAFVPNHLSRDKPQKPPKRKMGNKNGRARVYKMAFFPGRSLSLLRRGLERESRSSRRGRGFDGSIGQGGTLLRMGAQNGLQQPCRNPRPVAGTKSGI
jgi:hypothetical protein